MTTFKIVTDVASSFRNEVEVAFENRSNPFDFTIAFSGGSSARPCYETLVNANIDWNIVTAIWGDERLVPLDHPDSNYFVTNEVLLSKVLPLKNVYPMQDLKTYESLIPSLTPIDFVHLGIGPDGHTASLFPDSDSTYETDKYVITAGDEFHNHPRLTLTLRPINEAKQIVFTASGTAKHQTFKRIREQDLSLPASHVSNPNTTWLLDSKIVEGD